MIPSRQSTWPTAGPGPVGRAPSERTDAGVRIAALFTGAFVLAAAGELNGRMAATHWIHAEQLARLHPRINIQPECSMSTTGRCWPRPERPQRSTSAST